MQKKKWKKPELVVLVRGKPEESVLTRCKWDPPGALSEWGACGDSYGPGCTSCNLQAVS